MRMFLRKVLEFNIIVRYGLVGPVEVCKERWGAVEWTWGDGLVFDDYGVTGGCVACYDAAGWGWGVGSFRRG